MAQPADQFRRSDLVVWGAVAAVACALALGSANIAAIGPPAVLARLHSSRAANTDIASLTAEVAALDRSKSSVVGPTGAQQQIAAAQQKILAAEAELRSAQQQTAAAAAALDARVATLETTVAENGIRLSALKSALPRRVNAFTIGPGSSLITGSIGAPRGFGPVQPLPAPVLGPREPEAVQPEPASAAQTKPAPATPVPIATADPGPQWSAIAALPAFATPIAAAPDTGTPVAGAVTALDDSTTSPADGAPLPAPPLPMAPRPAAERAVPDASAAPAPPGAISRRATRRGRPDVKAIGIAIGNPVTPNSALGSWQQIAENVGVLLVGTSPLLADDPSGGAGKVLVAGPLPGIAAATALCGKIEQAALSCRPMPYVGAELNAAANYQ